jgi:hypothetical protein
VDQRVLEVACPPSSIFDAVLRVGGRRGWYAWDWLWDLRGVVDQMCGGVGSRRGRRDATCLLPGDTVDFWRVEEVEPDRLVRLAGEMRGPGRAWLQFELMPLEEGRTRLVQTAMWDPVGLLGHLYWLTLLPAHGLIFPAMIKGVVKEAGCREAPR